MIGIRIADGSFFPVLEENSGRRKIVLTAANKGQEKVRIDFLSDDYHLGSIFLDGIKDDSDIELIMESVGRTLIATATDTRTGNRGILNAVLPAPGPAIRPAPESAPVAPAEKKPEPEPAERPVPVSRPASGAACSPVIDRTVRNLQILLFVMTVILAFLSGVVVYAVVNMPAVTEKGTVVMFSEPEPAVTGPAVPEPVPAAPEPIPEPSAPEPAAPSPPVQEPAVSAPPVPQPPAHCCPQVYHGCPYHRHSMPPAVPPQPVYYVPEYIRYKVRYGDTLWSIARTFCTDPYMYLEIARENRIADPTKIYPGTILMIRVR